MQSVQVSSDTESVCVNRVNRFGLIRTLPSSLPLSGPYLARNISMATSIPMEWPLPRLSDFHLTSVAFSHLSFIYSLVFFFCVLPGTRCQRNKILLEIWHITFMWKCNLFINEIGHSTQVRSWCMRARWCVLFSKFPLPISFRASSIYRMIASKLDEERDADYIMLYAVCRHIFHSRVPFLSNEWNDMRQKLC